MQRNPYLPLTLEQLTVKRDKAEKWLKANKKHPKFSTYLQQYYLICGAWKFRDDQACKAWVKETIAILMHIFPGIRVEN